MADLGYGRGWLSDDAAASLWRVDAQIGHPLQITSAGRTRAQQQAAYDRWLAGTGSFAAYPGTSPHEFGNAIDTNERLVTILADHGWWRPLSFEPWHFVYRSWADNHINEPALSGGATVAPAPIIIEESEEDDMPKNSGFIYQAPSQAANERTVLICNYGSGLFHEYTNGVEATDSEYNSGIAKAFDIPGPFAPITHWHAESIKKSLTAG